MQLSVKGLAAACAVVWGAVILLVGTANLVWPGYGAAFLELSASLYPGYEPAGAGSIIIGTAYAFIDGAVGGAVFAWVYNRLAAEQPAQRAAPTIND